MCIYPRNFTILVEMKYFRSWATDTLVVEGDAVYADQRGNQLKMKIRKQLKGFSPIGSHGFLAL